jgi:sporulation protein YlmC with PRC-barrel domain
MSQPGLDAHHIDINTAGDEPLSGSGPGPGVMGASTLIGDDICASNGEVLGELKEIMLDMASGHVAYAVLETGGVVGIDSKLIAVPWSALRLDTVKKRLVLNVEKGLLDNAQGFDPHRWPDMANQSWTDRIHAYYGTQPHAAKPG